MPVRRVAAAGRGRNKGRARARTGVKPPVAVATAHAMLRNRTGPAPEAVAAVDDVRQRVSAGIRWKVAKRYESCCWQASDR